MDKTVLAGLAKIADRLPRCTSTERNQAMTRLLFVKASPRECEAGGHRLKNKRATLVYTSGAFSVDARAPAFGVDHHSTYMEAWLAQAGVTDIEEIRYQPTLLSADPAGDFARAKQAAAARATVSV